MQAFLVSFIFIGQRLETEKLTNTEELTVCVHSLYLEQNP